MFQAHPLAHLRQPSIKQDGKKKVCYECAETDQADDLPNNQKGHASSIITLQRAA